MKLKMSSLSLKSNSRVESIKKKFENSSFSQENKIVPSKSNHSTALNNLNLSSPSSKKHISLKTASDSAKADWNRTDGKAQIKRTPAFRREKSGSLKNVVKTVECSENDDPVVDLILHQQIGLNARKEFKSGCVQERVEPLTDNQFERLQRSKTDLFKNLDKDTSKVNCVKSTLVSKRINLLGENQNKLGDEISCYAVVDKNLKKTTTEKKQKETDLKLSESLRIALQSPLPKGPPPKKPPRTFCHVTSSAYLSSSHESTSVEMQKELPKLKSKLQKLESIITTHGRRVNASIPSEDFKTDMEEMLKKIPKTSDSSSFECALKKKKENQISLQLSSCLNSSTDTVLNEKFKKKGELHVDACGRESDCMEWMKDKSSKTCFNDNRLKKSVPEPVYDLPCITKSWPALHKKSSEVDKIEEGLHYLCTDVVNNLFHRKPPKLSPNERRELSAATNTFKPVENCVRGSKTLNDLTGLTNDMEQVLSLEKVFLSHSKVEGDEKGSRLDGGSVKSDSDSSQLSDSESDRKWSADSFDLWPKGFDGAAESEESHSTTLPVAKEFWSRKKAHPCSISSNLLFNCVPYWKRIKESNCRHLFECCLLVGLTLEAEENVPYIKKIFPPEAKPPPLIEALCFPDATNWPSNMGNEPEEQYYSLVITNEKGERKFGYCRRVLPEGSNLCLPLTYCIISPHRANGFFYKVLEELESKHGSLEVENFIRQLYEAEFPGPGEGLKLRKILVDATRSSFAAKDDFAASTIVRRPCDVRLEEKNLTQLFQALRLSAFLKVFSSLLRERKILFLSNSLRKLSCCIEALHSTLLPFSWQHTYIPVLPVQLLETCDSPTPYVIGLPKTKNLEHSLPNITFENGIMVDLDDSKIIKCCGDEGDILPQRLIKSLKTSLGLAVKATELSDANRNVLISDAFLAFFVEVCGHYSKFISVHEGRQIFEEKEFIKCVAPTAAQSFLEWFTKTAMFQAFINERLLGISEDRPGKLFSLRAMEYSTEALKNSPINYKVLNRKVKSLSDRIKDFVQ